MCVILPLSTIVIHAKDITGSDIYAGFMTTVFTLAALFCKNFYWKDLSIRLAEKRFLLQE